MRHTTSLLLAMAMTLLLAAATTPPALAQDQQDDPVRVGVIGLDTSHAPAFARLLNDEDVAEDLAGFEVVAAYPKGSENIESSVSRQPGYIEEFQEMGITITESIDELLDQVDVVLLTTNDGHPRLEQTLAVIRAGKPVFVDKPAAASLADVIAIYDAAEQHDVPLFTASSLRYISNAEPLLDGEHGEIRGVDTYSPASLEPTHPDLFWYMIHGVEPLFTLMGTGCETVSRAHTDGQDVVMGVWEDGRIGTVRGMRDMNPGYGGTAFTEEGTVDIGTYDGYRPLMVDAVRMFRSGEPPVPAEQSIAIYAFMEAADESKRQGGAPVKVADVIAEAREKAAERLEEHAVGE